MASRPTKSPGGVGLTHEPVAEDPSPDGKPGPHLTIWAVSDGRVGIEAQVHGPGRSRGASAAREDRRQAQSAAMGLGLLPWRLMPFPRRAVKADSPIAPPWRTSGSARAAPASRCRGASALVGRQDLSSSRPSTLAGALKTSTWWSRRRTRARRPECLSDRGRAQPHEPGRLRARPGAFPLAHRRAAEAPGWRSPSAASPIRTTWGRTGRAGWPPRSPARFKAAGGSLLVSFTRRTPKAAQRVLAAGLADVPAGSGRPGRQPLCRLPGPPPTIVLVTEDSTNLAPTRPPPASRSTSWPWKGAGAVRPVP